LDREHGFDQLQTWIFGSKPFLWNHGRMDDHSGVILATAAAIIASQALITGSLPYSQKQCLLTYGLIRKLIILPG
jgi:K+ transporter